MGIKRLMEYLSTVPGCVGSMPPLPSGHFKPVVTHTKPMHSNHHVLFALVPSSNTLLLFTAIDTLPRTSVGAASGTYL
jgi:hypothetical protein